MIVLTFSVYDIKSKTFGQPFHAMTRGVAVRQFQELVNNPETTINKHPDDFTLFEIGSFDDNTGEIKSMEEIGKQSVINALEVYEGQLPGKPKLAVSNN